MSSTIFSLLDLLASRFRSDSNENKGNGMSVQVSDSPNSSEPHSQPRSRSHTETTRPTNLGLPQQSNQLRRSPVQTRQNRSMTSHAPTSEPFDPHRLAANLTNNANNNNNNNNTTTTTTTTTTTGLPPSNIQNQHLNVDQPRRKLSINQQQKRRSTIVNNNGIPKLNLPNNNNTVEPKKSPRGQKQSPRSPRNQSRLSTHITTPIPTITTTTPTDTAIPTIVIVGESSTPNTTITVSPPTTQSTTTIPTDSNVIIANSNNSANVINTSTDPLNVGGISSSHDDGIELQVLTGPDNELVGDDDDDDMVGDDDDGEYYDDYEPNVDGEIVDDDKVPNVDDLEMAEVKPIPFSHKAFFKDLSLYFGQMISLVFLVTAVAVAYGVFEIFAGVRFVDISFSDWPTWGIVTHAISRIVLNCALCMYPYILLCLFFGFKETMVPLYIGIGSSLGSSVWATFNAVHPILNPTLALLPSYVFFVIAMAGGAHYMGHKINSPTFRHLFMGQFVAAAAGLVLYDFFIVPYYITASAINKSVVRILIHPAICAITLFIARACSSRITPHIPGTNVFPVLIFMWFSTYYGRFFNSNMSLLFMTGTMVIVSLLELLWRTTLRPRDKKILNAVCGYCFKRELTHSNNFDRIYRDFLRHEQLYENTSILVAACIYLCFYYVFQPDNFIWAKVLSSMAIQLALEWTTDCISLYIECRVHKMDVLRREPFPRGFYFMICYTFFLGMSYSTSRVVLITEGKWL